MSAYPRRAESIPPGSLAVGPYTVHFARSAEVLSEVQRLRFEVFNLELGEGLDASYGTGRDEDEFDAHCHHLLVSHARDGVVGTYRLMTTDLAARTGFYSQSEFDFDALPRQLLAESVELGRACVHQAHRNGAVLAQLWCAVARYMRLNAKRYLFGCCSVASLDPAVGHRLRRQLERRGVVHAALHVEPLPALRCGSAPPEDGDDTPLPRLFESYLSLGARVCGGPALDRAFKVLDFFMVLDVEGMSDAQREMLFRDRRWG